MSSLTPEMIEQLRDMVHDAIKPFADRLQHTQDKLARIDLQVNGRDGEFGIAQQVKVLWRSHVWVLCTLSAGFGSALTGVITWLMK